MYESSQVPTYATTRRQQEGCLAPDRRTLFTTNCTLLLQLNSPARFLKKSIGTVNHSFTTTLIVVYYNRSLFVGDQMNKNLSLVDFKYTLINEQPPRAVTRTSPLHSWITTEGMNWLVPPSGGLWRQQTG